MSAIPTAEELEQLADEADLSDYEQRLMLRNAVRELRDLSMQVQRQSRDIAELKSVVGLRGPLGDRSPDRRDN